jgi:hypothetical protein
LRVDQRIREIKEKHLEANMSRFAQKKKAERGLQARKLKIVRWKQKKISVFDLDVKRW